LVDKYFADKGKNHDLADCTSTGNCTERCNTGYANQSFLCGQCAYNFSHDGLTGRCKSCPDPALNTLVAIVGVVLGLIGLFVYIQITLSDGGRLDESDGVKSIGLSFIQLISLLINFPIAWPPIFVAIFQVGGAITVLGQHLVNLKCMFLDMTDGDVFFRLQLLWGIAPPILIGLCVLTWWVVSQTCFKSMEDVTVKMKSSCVALLYLLWPSLSSQTFSMFACRSVCDESVAFLRADLEVMCWHGEHASYALSLGMPMLLLYVLGLPLAAFLRVRQMHQELAKNAADVRVYGMFYTAFREETWWWEGTVAGRKIVIAMIGVFGAEMESMQVHLTAMLVFLIVLVTAQVRPFGGLKNGLLHRLEMFSLMATFLTLWAGSVFNTYPRCEDPLKGEGSTMPWCDALSVSIGASDIAVVVAVVVCFVWLKTTAGENREENMGMEDGGNEARRSRMESADVMSFGNPSLGAETVTDAGGLSIEMTERSSETNAKKGRTNVNVNASATASASANGSGEQKVADPVTSFTNPRLDAATLSSTQELSIKVAAPSSTSSNSMLPDGWIEHETGDGQPYYEHRASNVIQWEKPTTSSSSS